MVCIRGCGVHLWADIGFSNPGAGDDGGGWFVPGFVRGCLFRRCGFNRKQQMQRWIIRQPPDGRRHCTDRRGRHPFDQPVTGTGYVSDHPVDIVGGEADVTERA